MDLYWKALLLGIVEGLTEFLPISSTGHLILTAELIGFDGDTADTFKIFIQLGAILAVCWYYRTRLAAVARGLPGDPASRRFVLNLAVAFVPAAVIGFLFHGTIKSVLFSPVVVATALIVGGIAILVIERFAGRPEVESVDDLTWRHALKVGFAQAAALIPGVSRSGATIMGGLVFGLSRRTAAEFSFFLAIPTMFAAAFYDLFKSRDLLSASDAGVFAVGFIAAFLSALASVKFLLQYLARHDFSLFAWYRIVFGCIVLGYYTL